MKHYIAFLAKKLTRNKSDKQKQLISSNLDFQNPFDIKKTIFHNLKNLTIFDVGAYHGEIALFYNEIFPNSQIYCFEPFTESFKELENRTMKLPNISCFDFAFSNACGDTSFSINSFSPTNSILATHAEGNKSWDNRSLLDTKEVTTVKTNTIDNFIEESKIPKINILKLDVQGAEHLVLEGTKKSLSNGIIDLIYLEIILLPTYEKQTSLADILLFLKNYGFSLYNFYNFSHTENGVLRQVDAIFIKSTNFE